MHCTILGGTIHRLDLICLYIASDIFGDRWQKGVLRWGLGDGGKLLSLLCMNPFVASRVRSLPIKPSISFCTISSGIFHSFPGACHILGS